MITFITHAEGSRRDRFLPPLSVCLSVFRTIYRKLMQL